jgi:hypothetical protein
MRYWRTGEVSTAIKITKLRRRVEKFTVESGD